MSSEPPATETELDRFREQWREEVARNRRPARQSTSSGVVSKELKQKTTREGQAGPSQPRKVVDYSEEIEPKSYHDLPDKEEHLKLVNAGQDHDRDLFKEPVSALEHYERAVEKETQGQLGESLKHYRQAFKVCCRVHNERTLTMYTARRRCRSSIQEETFPSQVKAAWRHYYGWYNYQS